MGGWNSYLWSSWDGEPPSSDINASASELTFGINLKIPCQLLLDPSAEESTHNKLKVFQPMADKKSYTIAQMNFTVRGLANNCSGSSQEVLFFAGLTLRGQDFQTLFP